jgi:hypothetical protein
MGAPHRTVGALRDAAVAVEGRVPATVALRSARSLANNSGSANVPDYNSNCATDTGGSEYTDDSRPTPDDTRVAEHAQRFRRTGTSRFGSQRNAARLLACDELAVRRTHLLVDCRAWH